MKPFEIELDLSPDVFALARRLAHSPGLAVLWTADGTGPSYIAAHPLERSQGFDPEPALAIGRSTDSAWNFPRWIGALPYEALRAAEVTQFWHEAEQRPAPHLSEPHWLRYGAVLRVDSRVVALGDDEQAVLRLVREVQAGKGSAQALQLRRVGPQEAALHRERIVRAQEQILDGEFYLVNLARRFDFSLQGQPIDLLQQLGRTTRPRYGSCLQLGDVTVVGTSPELFLRLDADRRVTTAPIKGTRPRSADPASDQALAEQLARDPKESAELSMVIDVERNDLGRVSEVGSVRIAVPPTVQACGTLWHRLAEVESILAQPHGREALLRSMAPSGSVTGAPKVRAMQAIAQWESTRRGLYTGALGFVAHSGGMTLAMAIRTVTLKAGMAHYHAGGGIVVDSDPDQEVAETEWKASQILDLSTPLGAAVQ